VLSQPDIGTPVGLRDRAILEVLYSTGIRRLESVQLSLPIASLIGNSSSSARARGREIDMCRSGHGQRCG
jgi:integrase/recombinase XerD